MFEGLELCDFNFPAVGPWQLSEHCQELVVCKTCVTVPVTRSDEG